MQRGRGILAPASLFVWPHHSVGARGPIGWNAWDREAAGDRECGWGNRAVVWSPDRWRLDRV